MNNDLAVGLREIASRHEKSLIERIVETQKRHAKVKESPLAWITRMKVLGLRSGSGSTATPIRTSHQNEWLELTDFTGSEKYLALSYVWKPSSYEDAAQYSWKVRSSKSGTRKAEVRDAVLDRVVRYMKHYSVDYLWVDGECINQKDPDQKMQAMQAMDKVYNMSDWPLAVLFVPVRTHRELELLTDLLQGTFIRQASKRKQGQWDGELTLEPSLDEEGEYEVLDFLHRLTSDPWWSRAWCFQEEYVVEGSMELLIPHFLGSSAHIDQGLFGRLTKSGDLVLNSHQFRTEATKFVFAYVYTAKRKRKDFDRGICLQILDIVGKYTLMGKHGHLLDLDVQGKSMSTLVLSDLGVKHYTVPSDILNIAANCNLYSRAMSTTSLDETGDSLSIAILTMWFSNGETFWNNGLADPTSKDRGRCAHWNVFQYLNSIAFDACPPIGEQGRLTYRKKFRFLKPKLTAAGVHTLGHLFRIRHAIRLEADVLEGSEPEEVLSFVVKKLRGAEPRLAARLDRFIRKEFNKLDATYPSRRAMSLSAKNLVSRLHEKPVFYVGSVLHGTEDTEGPIDAGIFAFDGPVTSQRPRYVFTSWEEGSGGTPGYKNQPEEDKYMSIRVSVTDSSMAMASPQLRTEAWTDSLCFYECAQWRPYTFPWPASLHYGLAAANDISSDEA
ncbi:hypothetical protein LTR70_005049 [Exophiala xenobiotica]|uniref:Heterokaryon incompatibility domain-containing protein n=1 Tax=Lithohypha guttulata TaxID=1690604 RepID=A0ABR0K8P0_9EURO|nr:hypothetical protein LTR24_005525 [Lithohypha guttulata]KAK5319296.1 hypothetical protein LTR70_005049 [Exophiala xenobiotica]